MLKIENTEVYGWEAAIRGMRNPKNSWDKSDSGYAKYDDEYEYDWFNVGKNDLKLMRTLVKAGTDHGKFLRMINVTMDVTAPLYWWKEYDTYKIATVANSTSTMHKIASKPFSLDDFSHEEMNETALSCLKQTIQTLETLRLDYLQTKDKQTWYSMIQLLPSSYHQLRTCSFNYETLVNIYHARHAHKLTEWHVFCDWIRTLPYAREIIIMED